MGVVTLCLLAAALILLGVGSAVFSAMQVAVATLRPAELNEVRSAPHRSSRASMATRALDRLVLQPRRVMGGLFLAETLANLPLIVLCIFLIDRLPSAWLLPTWAPPLLIFGVVVVLCDLLPKAVGLAKPLLVVRLFCSYSSWVLPLLEPVSTALEDFADRIAALLLPARMKPRRSLDDEEIETLVQLGEEEGTLGSDESEMIQEILKLGDKTAKDCMTPRVDIHSLPDDLSPDEVVDRLKRFRYRRVPVFGEDQEDIIGILDVGKFLTDPSAPYTERLQPPSFVSETMPALDLLRSFLTHRQVIAVVLDEFGGVEGLVTRSDLVEEILGDAVPIANATLYIESLEDGRVVAGGHARLDDLEEIFDVPLEEEGIDTVGGVIFNLLGHLPSPGEEVLYRGLRFRVRRTGKKRIQELLIERVGSSAPVPGRERP